MFVLPDVFKKWTPPVIRKMVRFLLIGLVVLVVLVALAAVLLPSQIAQTVLERTLDERGISHAGTDTVFLSLIKSQASLGPITLGEGADAVRIGLVELDLDGGALWDQQVKIRTATLTGLRLVAERLPSGGMHIGGEKLSEWLGVDKSSDDNPDGDQTNPKDAEEASDTDGFGFGIDDLLITSSIVLVKDLNGGEYELVIDRARLTGLKGWGADGTASFSISGSFNGAPLTYEGKITIKGDQTSLKLTGTLKELTQAALARADGSTIEKPVAGSVSASLTHQVMLGADDAYNISTQGIVTFDSIQAGDAAEGSLALPKATLSMDLRLVSTDRELPDTSGVIALKAPSLTITGPDGGAVELADLDILADGISASDLSTPDGVSFAKSFGTRVQERNAEKTLSLGELLLSVVVAAAQEAVSHNLLVSGTPSASVGKITVLLPGAPVDGKPGPALLKADIAEAMISAPGLKMTLEQGAWAYEAGLALNVSSYAGTSAFSGDQHKSSVRQLAFDAQAIKAKTDGDQTTMSFDLALSFADLQDQSPVSGALAIQSGMVVSPGLTVNGDNALDGSIQGSLAMRLKGLTTNFPSDGSSGRMTVKGARLDADLNELEIRHQDSATMTLGGQMSFEHWQLDQADSPLSAAFRLMRLHLPLATISLGDGGLSVVPGGSAKRINEVEPKEPEAAELGEEAVQSTSFSSGGIPIPVPRSPNMAEAFAVADAAKAEAAKRRNVSRFGVNLYEFSAAVPSAGKVAKVEGKHAHLGLQRFKLATGAAPKATLAGELSFTGWNGADGASAASSSVEKLEMNISSLAIDLGDEFGVSGSVAAKMTGVNAATGSLGEGEAKDWAVTLASLSTDLKEFEVRGEKLRLAGDLTADSASLKQAGKYPRSIEVGELVVDQARYDGNGTNIRSLTARGLVAVLDGGLIPAKKPKQAKTKKPAAAAPVAPHKNPAKPIAPVRFERIEIGRGSAVTYRDRLSGQAARLDPPVKDMRLW
ncbi:MAG: hypothetical protein ACKVGZ_00795, partial [Alphaproteobacteria bacterium]